MFYIPSLSFLTPLLPGRQEGQLRAAVPLPKLTASKDEGPLFIALPGLLLSNRFHFTSIEKMCSVHFRAMPAPQSRSMTMEKLLWSVLKIQLGSFRDFVVFKFKLFPTFQKYVENIMTCQSRCVKDWKLINASFFLNLILNNIQTLELEY